MHTDSGHTDRLTRNIGVPAWMVTLFGILLFTACGTIGGVIVVDRQQVHRNTIAIGVLDARLSRTEEKTKDILDALGGIRQDIKEMMRRMP